MKKDKTEIVIILDRSGSMCSVKNAMEEGSNSFVNNQKQVDGNLI